MNLKKSLMLVLLAFTFSTTACVYIVLPEGLEDPEANSAGSKFWSAVVTKVDKSEAGDLHVDITIRNDTGQWSTLQAAADKPVVLTTSDGKSANCDTVYVGTGGHRLAPGFQMRGYTAGTPDAPKTQLLYVECKGAAAAAGSTLSINYVSFNGILDDYATEANKTESKLVLKLDEVATNLTYPVASPVEGLIKKADASITGLSDNQITLLETKRTETGLEFTWQNYNPTKFALKTHIGTPPVIGTDGIIYGVYETIDIVPVPLTPAKANIQWTTAVIVPPETKGFYILLSVESNKPRTYINYALDISDK